MSHAATAHAHADAQPAPAEKVALRHDWTVEEIQEIHDAPLLELVYRAQTVHRQVWKDNKVQLSSLLSIKTGGCSEDCAYCPQAARYKTGVEAEKLMPVDKVLCEAQRAKDAGATRFCMGAAWREVKNNAQFDQVLEMVKGVRGLGMEACATLGMLSAEQAQRLKEAGLTAYNHNLDTSPEHYGSIISTRTYEDRLRTLANVRSAGINVCSGGIIGLGESVKDRCGMLMTLANQPEHPESVPINTLVAVEGTPLQDQKPVEAIELIRMIATARILMPASMVRLSAGRKQLSQEGQLMCMMAGANSIFFGDKLLTTGNPEYSEDMALLAKAGIGSLPART
jgi:biotin synthase